MKRTLGCILVIVAVLTLLIVIFVMPASAATDGYYTYTVTNGDATITDVDSSIAGEITIPLTIGGYPVTSIGSFAFDGCSGLTSITIPDSVTNIGDYAFSRCSGLTSITIPDNVTTIGWGAFENCLGLNSIVFGLNSRLESISREVFRNCIGLKSITIPNCVKWIGPGVFTGCTGLESITIPSCVTEIGSGVFTGCTGLESIKVESGNTIYQASSNCLVETTSKTLIAGCKNSIIPSDGSVTSIGMEAFSGCVDLTDLSIPKWITSIDHSAFEDCKRLVSIRVEDGNTKYHSSGNCVIETASKTLVLGCKNSIIPTDGSVTSIGIQAFSGCVGLTEITIPEGITSIDWRAFYASGLTSITLPSTLKHIENNAFLDCNKLVEVYNLSTLCIEMGSSSNGDIGGYALDIYTSMDATSKRYTKDQYVFYVDEQKIFLLGYSGDSQQLVLPNDFNGEKYEIYEYAFEERNDITSVEIPNSVTHIHVFAFYNCTRLSNITIPSSVEFLGQDAFNGCTGLKSISVLTQGADAGLGIFANCSNLVSVYLSPNCFDSIAGYMFAGCISLENIEVPEGITAIGDHVFEYCCRLKSIKMPKSINSISVNVFDRCSATIYCYEDSAAHRVVIYKNLDFVLIRDENTQIPNSPELLKKTETSITLVPIDGYEYKLGDGEWQNSNTFNNLQINTEYTIFQRVAQTKWVEESSISTPLTIATNNHNFVVQDTSLGYLESEADCTHKATYYFSCEECSLKGTETFEYGEYGHKYSSELTQDKTTHYYECFLCHRKKDEEIHNYSEYFSNYNNSHSAMCKCGKKDTQNCSGGTSSCTEQAICEVCGSQYGCAFGHDFSIDKHDSDYHWQKCAQCDEIYGKEAHFGGTVTCIEKAKCQVCDTEYGEFIAHNFFKLMHSEFEHWYECVCGEITGKVTHAYDIDGECICGAEKTVEGETKEHSEIEESSDIKTQHEEPDTSDSVDIIKGGCGSVIVSGSVVMIATICCGAVIFLKRKKTE